MSKSFTKIAVVVLFAAGIFAFVYFKSTDNPSDNNATEEITGEEPNEAPGGIETSAEEQSNEKMEEPAAAEKTTPDNGKTSKYSPKTDVQQLFNQQQKLDQIFIPSSKSIMPVDRPKPDPRSTFKPDSLQP